MNEIMLKSIYELLGKNYFIPSYQRGYKWEKRQIYDLLEDLYKYQSQVQNKGSFYCLQPIVVKQCDEDTIKANNLKSDLDDNKWYEVIDGQQRLTTIYLLFKYFIKNDNIDLLNDYDNTLFNIVYQNHNNAGYLEDPSIECNDSVNAYYVTNAYKEIENWFNEARNEKNIRQIKLIRGKILDLLINDKNSIDDSHWGYVQVIWYEVSLVDPIKIFTRLNIGKIPLTNSELIKALFLEKRDKSSEEKENQKVSDETIEKQRIQISKEWDQIEATLQESRMWAFLNKEIHTESLAAATHIDFIFNLIFNIAKKDNIKEGKNDFDEKYSTDEYASFRYFSEKFENASSEDIKKEWDNIWHCYETLKDWREKPLWYHYIGFLIYCGEPIISIYEMYQNKSKKEFEQNLKNRIREKLDLKYVVNADNTMNIIDSKGNIIAYDNDTKNTLRRILVLYNIEHFVQKNIEVKSSYIEFPFDLFKSEKWDIEHIDSKTTNPLNEKEQQDAWIKSSLEALMNYNIKPSKENNNIIQNFLNNKENSNFESVYAIISTLAGEDYDQNESSLELKNSLGNLTLLNANINREYGNSIFLVKRKIIQQRDSEGKFIPLCTKNVFFKSFADNTSNLLFWKEEDIKNYQTSIINTIKEFLTKDESR